MKSVLTVQVYVCPFGLFNWKGRMMEREKKLFCPLTHSTTACNSKGCVRSKPGARTPNSCPTWVSGSHVPCNIHCPWVCALAGSWIGSRGTWVSGVDVLSGGLTWCTTVLALKPMSLAIPGCLEPWVCSGIASLLRVDFLCCWISLILANLPLHDPCPFFKGPLSKCVTLQVSLLIDLCGSLWVFDHTRWCCGWP